MAQILILEKFPLKSFFLRRFSRIYPVLFAFSTVIFAASVAASCRGYKFNSLVGPLDYLAALTIWINYKIVYFGQAGALNHLWSISIEEHAYIILAALAAAFYRRRSIGWLIAALAIFALANGVVRQLGGEGWVLLRTDVRIAPLFLSFAIRLGPEWLRKAMGLVAPLLLVLAYVMAFSDVPPVWQLVVNSVLLSVAVNGLDYASAIFRMPFEGGVMRFVGVTSYSLYIWQQPFYTMHERVNPFILLFFAVAVAYGSYYVLEQPTRRYLNSKFSKVS